MQLVGKVAIVTGSSRGIGKAVALILAREGAAVVVAARTEKEKEDMPGTIYQTADEIRALGGRALPVKTDITSDEDVERMAQRTIAEFGRIDILVNNAAANYNSSIADLPVKRWDVMMQVNLRGTFICTKAVLPMMITQHRGNIVCLTSIAAKRMAPPGEVCYGITKAGIEFFCWGLAQEVKQYNIAVNDIYPAGLVTTDGMKAAFRNVKLSDDLVRTMKNPREIAEAILWLATRDASFTGHSVSDEEVKNYIQGLVKP